MISKVSITPLISAIKSLRLNQVLIAVLALSFLIGSGIAQTLNLYTKPVSGASGGITGHTDQELIYAIALEHNRTACYKGGLSEGGKAFTFTGLPTGKYDLLLLTSGNVLYEGLAMGEQVDKLSSTEKKNLEERVAKADSFFNRAVILRFAVEEDGEKITALVERIRDKTILKGSGDVLNSNLRRLEIVDFVKAGDDWQMGNSRHIYREEQPVGAGMPFLSEKFLAELGNIRVIDASKDIGMLRLPSVK